MLGLYLAALGLSPLLIGLVTAAAIGGSAVMTIVWSILADRYGRRRTVMTMAALMAAGGFLFAIASSPWLLVLAAFTGTISATSSEVGVFNTVDQAVLPQVVPPERRTARYVCVLALAVPDSSGASGRPVMARGTCRGRIAGRSKGSGGFGYDPIFEPWSEPPGGRTLGQWTAEQKNRISHRARAARRMARRLTGRAIGDAGRFVQPASRRPASIP